MSSKRTIWAGALAAAALAIAGAGAPSASAATTITEAGSSLVYPIASVWALHYHGATVDTAAGGSDKGIQAIIHNQIDIGASDLPMIAAQFQAGTADYVQIPWALSAVGIGYNLPGIGNGLRLDATVLAEIYTGKITTWASPAIAALNSTSIDRALARDGRISPVFRSDGSGASYAFQRFLSAAHPNLWKLGYSGAFGGTTGVAANGDAGVADQIEQNKGSIGYISGDYLLQQHLSVARIANAAGNYEYPNISNIEDAAGANPGIPTQGPSFGGVPIVDPPKKLASAYPISTYSYAIVSKSDSRLSAIQAFLNWVISVKGGQQYGVSLDFAPLPATIRAADTKLIAGTL